MFLLIPSPLLGPATAVLDAVVAAAGNQSVVLVPHSNAGLYAPPLGSLVDVRATVFVDAALPGPEAGQGETQLAPPAFLEFVGALANRQGVLPPWTEWWGEDVGDLFPDAAVRRTVEREQQRLPLTYFTSRIPVPGDWAERRAAYLAFGATYADERERAARLGWATTTMAGNHLHALHDPAAVGTAVLALTHRALL